MHYNIYLDDKIAKQLQHETKISQLSRNAIIRKAIKNWLENNKNHWSKEILDYQADQEFPAFESYRKELKQKKDDPFS